MVGTEESQPLFNTEIIGSLLVVAIDLTVLVLTRLLWELAQRPD